MKKGLKVNTIAWIASAVVLVAAVPINMIFSKFDVKVDVTPFNAYSLSDGAKEALENIDKPVEMTVLYELDALYEGSEPGEAEYMMADMFVSTIRQMAEFDKISLKEINIEKNPEYVNEIDPEGYMNLAAGDIVLECGNLKRDVSFQTLFTTNSETGSVEFYGENAIIGAIDYLESGITPTIYFTEGHGEKKMESYSTLVNLIKTQNYDVKSLNIASEGSIPNDALTVVIAAPVVDISADEKKILLDYAQQGGNISMLIAPQKKETVFRNIESILETYEIEMCYNRIYETQSGYSLGDDQYTILCQYTDVDFNKAIIDAQGSQSLYMPSVRSFNCLSEEDTSLTVEALIQTYDYTKSELFGGKPASGQMAPNGALCVAAKSEDPDRNYSKLFVAGSSEFIDDETISLLLEKYDEASLAPYLFLSTISWMDKANSTTLYPTRVHSTDYITIPDKKTGNVILVIMIAFPILIAASGVIVWARRHNA